MIRKQILLFLILILGFATFGVAQDIVPDSVEIIYDTVYAPDTIRQTEEVIVYETEEYVLDLCAGFAVGYQQPWVRLQADSAMSSQQQFGWVAELPFRANFRPWLIETGISLQQTLGQRTLNLWTPQQETFHKKIIDTLDVYYVTRNGVRSERAVTRRRDSSWTVTHQIKSQSQITARYTWLSIPLLLGYQYDARRFSLSATAGVYASFLLATGSGNQQSDGSTFFTETTAHLRRWSVWPAAQLSVLLPISQRCDLALQSNAMFGAGNQFSSQKYSLQIQHLAIKFAFFYHF